MFVKDYFHFLCTFFAGERKNRRIAEDTKVYDCVYAFLSFIELHTESADCPIYRVYI